MSTRANREAVGSGEQLGTADVADVRSEAAPVSGVRVFANSGFRALFGSNLGNAMGMQLRLMAQAWVILELGGSQFWVGAASGLQVVPAIAISIMSGAMIDRLGGKVVLAWDRLSLMLVAAVTSLIILTGVVQLWHIVVLSVIAGSVLALGLPAANTLVAHLVSREELQAANSLNQLTFVLGRSLGPLAGGFLLASFGIGSPYLAITGMYALALIATLMIPRQIPEDTGGQAPLERIREGMTYVWQNRTLRVLMFLAVSAIFGMTQNPAIPIYAKDVLNVGEIGFGMMIAAMAVGQGVAAVWITLRGGFEHKGRAAVLAVLVYSASAVVFAYSRIFPLTLGMLFISGFVLPVWISSVVTLLQTSSEPSKLGRVMGMYSISLQVAFGGWLLGGWLGEAIGNELMLVTTSAAFAGLNVFAYWRVKTLRSV